MQVQNLKKAKDVKRFFTYLLNVKGVNFHPDTPFVDYVHTNSKTPFFTKAEALRLEVMMGKAFEICDNEKVDIYEIGVNVFDKFYNN